MLFHFLYQYRKYDSIIIKSNLLILTTKIKNSVEKEKKCYHVQKEYVPVYYDEKKYDSYGGGGYDHVMASTNKHGDSYSHDHNSIGHTSGDDYYGAGGGGSSGY